MSGYRYATRAEILGASIYDHEPDAIVLNSGLAYPPLLPDVIREATEAARSHVEETLQYGPLMGIDDLRDEVVRFVAEDEVRCSRENILITYGAKNALDLALRVFVEPGDRVITTRPTYMTALQIIRSHQAPVLDIGQDDEGFLTDELEEKLKRLRANGEPMPKLLFDVPDFHNPTGITTSLPRRRKMLELAREFGFVILEDDPYRRVRFEGEPVPPLKALDDDAESVVISLGTVSKILAPGLRVGWAIGAPEVVKRMSRQKADGGSNPFTQRMVTELMRGNKLSKHIADIAAQMRLHRDAMTESLREFLPDAGVRPPQGGYFLWATLPSGIDGDTLATAARKHGVEVSSGRLSYPNEYPRNRLRLAFSFVGPDHIREGVRALGGVYDDLKKQEKNNGV
ncbi:MAG: PLP-dependent aminotransferase family protein [Alphaproteobacteria bacterium]|nr:PLP-dependent aminotransferase family protein [Alphaproteobacteria bacterium]